MKKKVKKGRQLEKSNKRMSKFKKEVYNKNIKEREREIK